MFDKKLLTFVWVLALGLGVWTLAVTFTPATFQEGDVVSATALNDVINSNFEAAKTAIDALESFDAALAAGACESGQAMQAVAADGSVSCASLGSAGVVPAVSVTLSSNLSVNSGPGVTRLAFDSEFFDTANMHDDANPTRLTVPEDGIYQVSANVTWSPNGTGTRTLAILRNNQVRMADSRTVASTTNPTISQSVSGLLQLEAGDVLELVVLQDSGTALQLLAGAPLKFEMVRVASAP